MKLNIKTLLAKICNKIIALTTQKSDIDTLTDKLNVPVNVVSNSISSSVSVKSSTYTQLGTVTLSAGTWLIFCRARFPSNATGRRAIYLSNRPLSEGNPVSTAHSMMIRAVNGGTTMLSLACAGTPSSSATYYLIGWQNSGSALSVSSAGIACYRIHP